MVLCGVIFGLCTIHCRCIHPVISNLHLSACLLPPPHNPLLPLDRRLVKAGLLPERYSRPLSRVSNYGELVGYVGSITLSLLRISLLLEREVALIAELQRRHKVSGWAGLGDVALSVCQCWGEQCSSLCQDQLSHTETHLLSVPAPLVLSKLQLGMSEEDDDGSVKALGTEIRILRARRMLRTLGLVQDLAGGCWQDRGCS